MTNTLNKTKGAGLLLGACTRRDSGCKRNKKLRSALLSAKAPHCFRALDDAGSGRCYSVAGKVCKL